MSHLLSLAEFILQDSWLWIYRALYLNRSFGKPRSLSRGYHIYTWNHLYHSRSQKMLASTQTLHVRLPRYWKHVYVLASKTRNVRWSKQRDNIYIGWTTIFNPCYKFMSIFGAVKIRH